MSGKNEKYYRFHMGEFQKLTTKWLSQKPKWKKQMVFVWLCIISVVLVFAFCVFGIGAPTGYGNGAVMMVAVLIGIFFAFMPAIAAIILYFHGRRKIGNPFTHMSKMFLYTNYSGLQFGYHDTADKRQELIPGGRMTVWQIAYENIRWVNINPKYKLITVLGRTESVVYADITSGRVEGKVVDGQYGEFGTISFFDCFDNREGFLETLKENGVDIRYCEVLVDTEDREQFLLYLSQNGVQVGR